MALTTPDIIDGPDWSLVARGEDARVMRGRLALDVDLMAI
jgi:hypothetical protein